MPAEQYLENSKRGLFVRDESGRFEGMNKHGLFAVSLTMEPTKKRKNPRSNDINEEILLKCRTVKGALRYFFREYEKYDMGFNELIGDKNHVFYIEVSIDQIAFVDLSRVNYFVCANHGLLLFHQGAWDDDKNSSHMRLSMAKDMIKNVRSYSDLKLLLAAHRTSRKDKTICAHDKRASFTVGAYLFTPANNCCEVCLNAFPCEAGFTKYKLKM